MWKRPYWSENSAKWYVKFFFFFRFMSVFLFVVCQSPEKLIFVKLYTFALWNVCVWTGTVLFGCARSVYLETFEGAITGTSWQERQLCLGRSHNTCWWAHGATLFVLASGCLSHTAVSLLLFFHQQECQYLLLRLCCADEEQIFAKDPNLYVSLCLRSWHTDEVLLMSCVWDWVLIHLVSPVFTPTVVGLLLCDRHSDVAGQCSGQTAEAALPDCWRVCVRRPAHFHQLRFIQPSKKQSPHVELRGFHHQLNIQQYNSFVEGSHTDCDVVFTGEHEIRRHGQQTEEVIRQRI